MKAFLLYQNRARLSALALIQTLRTIGTVGVAVLINLLIDAVQTAIATGSMERLTACAVICAGYALLLGAIIFLSEKLSSAVIKHIMLHLRQAVMHGILKKSISDFQRKNSAEYLTLLSQNMTAFEENYLKNLISIYDSVVGILIAVILLLWINPVIAVISIAAMAVPSLIPKFFGKKLGALQSDIMQNTAVYHAKVKDILNGFEVIRAYRTQAQMEKAHDGSSHMLESSKAHMADTMAVLYALANTASIAVQFLIMSLAGVFAVKGLITIGSIIAVTQLTGQVISPAFQLSAKISQFKAARPICGQIKEYALSASAHSGAAAIPETEHAFALEDVSFSYEADFAADETAPDIPVRKRLALHHVSQRFERGKKYAVVGKSGSGKSTLLKLLAGYYDNYSGRLLSDGTACGQLSTAFIHQDVFLFDDTIRNNITLYGSYDDQETYAACRLAGLTDVIDGLSDGIDTEVSENGGRFSGGEKQRIAIARAILHKKNVILLDEATSALDNETTNFVEDSLLSLADVTCVAVTHRLTPHSLRKYDEILVMEDGRIVERGDYQSLLKRSGAFAKLYSAGAT